MADQDKMDRLLDRALGEYGQASPRAGLENRVLARLEAEGAGPRPVRWWWIAVPALMVIAVLGAWRPRPQKVEIASVPLVRVGVQPTPPTMTETPPQDWVVKQPPRPLHRKQPMKARPKGRDSEPRLATFPSRDSDDQLVKLAMQFVEAHPAEAKEIVQQQKEFREMAEAFTAPLKEEK